MRSSYDSDRDHETAQIALKIVLTEDELAAVEGWRGANGVASTQEAVQELMKIGLLSDLHKVHQFLKTL